MQMEHFIHEALRTMDRMGPTEWVLGLGGVIVIGLFCMRGFGSRSSY